MSTDLTGTVATEASELALARRVIETEADAVRAVAGRLDGRIPYAHAPTLFARTGNALPLAIAALLLVASLVALRRRAR